MEGRLELVSERRVGEGQSEKLVLKGCGEMV